MAKKSQREHVTAIKVKGLTSLIDSATIFDLLLDQQKDYMKRHHVKDVLVFPKHLKYYAALCAAAYQRQLKKCKTTKDHRQLFNAFVKRLKTDSIRPEFLKAVPITAINAAAL